MAFRVLQQAMKGLLPVVQQQASCSARCAVNYVVPATKLFPACTVSSTRKLHSSVKTFALADSLQKELKDAEEYERDPVLDSIPNGFKLEEQPGSAVLTLKKMLGNEEISVVFSPLNQSDPDEVLDEDDEVDARYPTTFSVKCTKGDQVLTFECVHVEEEDAVPSIEHVSMEPKGGFPPGKELELYSGPVTDELDDDLQAELSKYIQERGITGELGQWICCMNYDKEHREYTAWLKKFIKYVNS